METIEKINEREILITSEVKQVVEKSRLLEEKEMFSRDIQELQNRIKRIDDLLKKF